MLRVVDRAGLQVALDLALTGRRVARGEGEEARPRRRGVPRARPPRGRLRPRARPREREATARDGKKPKKSALAQHLRTNELATAALEDNPLGRALLFKKAREETRKKTHGHYPAAERIIDVLERYGSREEAFARRRGARGEVVRRARRERDGAPAHRDLLRDDGAEEGQRRRTTPSVKPREVEHVGMLGGGLMGGGIAYVTIQAGIPVRLKDKDDAGVGRGLKYVRGILDERAKKKQITREELDQRFARLTGDDRLLRAQARRRRHRGGLRGPRPEAADPPRGRGGHAATSASSRRTRRRFRSRRSPRRRSTPRPSSGCITSPPSTRCRSSR